MQMPKSSDMQTPMQSGGVINPMPPQPQVTEQQIRAIVQYVRELQIANGIRYHPHRM
jgi:cytochrome c1